MTIAHCIRRVRRLSFTMRITLKAATTVHMRATRGGLYIFRDCPTRICVLFARGGVSAPELADAALDEVLMRIERRRIRNGWPDRSGVA